MQPLKGLTVVTPKHAIAAARLGVSWDVLKAKRADHGGDPRQDAVPALGAHTDAVLAELGVAPSEIGELRAAQEI